MATATINPDASPAANARPAARPRWRRVVGFALRAAERFLAVFGLLVLVYFGCFRLSTMISESMTPTLQGTAWENGDTILTEKVSFHFRRPRRWEIISYTQHGGEVMKRVIGFPGERVQIIKNRILINGQELPRPESLKEITYYGFGNLTAGEVAECGDGYYVLGDYSRDSDDSRFNGPVPPEQIIGRPWAIISPEKRRGWVNASY